MRIAVPICFTILVSGLTLFSCSKEGGKYEAGKDDPALKVKDKDIAQVNKTLDKQAAVDKANGLRKGIAPPHDPGKLNETAMAMVMKRPEADALQAQAMSPPTGPGAANPVGNLPEGPVSMGALVGNLPSGWTSRPPSSSMRVAEFGFGAASGDSEGGVVAVTTFGAGQGGSVDANIDRWMKQFQPPAGTSAKDAAHVDHLKAGNMNITLLDTSGTMLPSGMPGGSPTPKPNWRMLGAIVETPSGMYFFKATGPQNTMGENRDKMVKFLTSLKAK